MNRRLAAILAADVVGYSRQMGADEAGTMARLRALRAEVIDPLMAEHGGRVFKTTGDGLLAEFSSVVQALRCALAIQQRQRADPSALALRIGLHSGDVMVDGDDLLGDGVNIAARIEPLAEPGGIVVTARVHEDAAGKIPLDVEDLGTPELKNIAQPVRVFRVRLGVHETSSPGAPDRPALVVLPFQNMSGDPEQEYFADGIVEDITTALSRTGWLYVVARNSAFTYKGRAVDVRQVARELGVRYVLEGSVRRAGSRLRITCQLIEAAAGHHVWADRFDSDLVDIFDLQDRITESVVGAIEPSLRRAEIARAVHKPTGSLDAYDLYLRAVHDYHIFTRPSLDRAVELLQRALAIDPNYQLARGYLAWILEMRVSNGMDTPGEAETSVMLARQVIASGTDDPAALRGAAIALMSAHDYSAAFAALNRALRLHPNSAPTLSALGYVHCHADDPGPAVGYFERVLRLSPLDVGMGYVYGGLGMAHLMMGRDADAHAVLVRAVEETPNWTGAYRFLIFACMRLGRIDAARAAVARMLEVNPDYRLSLWRTEFSNAAFTDEFVSALRAAGVPE